MQGEAMKRSGIANHVLRATLGTLFLVVALSVIPAAAHQRMLSGFRDNTWFVQTRGSDYDLAPPATKRVSVVRTIYAEADGVALPDPDPSNPQQREFAWMTALQFWPDRAVTYPFQDIDTLVEQP